MFSRQFSPPSRNYTLTAIAVTFAVAFPFVNSIVSPVEAQVVLTPNNNASLRFLERGEEILEREIEILRHREELFEEDILTIDPALKPNLAVSQDDSLEVYSPNNSEVPRLSHDTVLPQYNIDQ